MHAIVRTERMLHRDKYQSDKKGTGASTMALPGPAPPLLLLLLLPLTAAAAAATPSAQLPAVAPCNFTEGVDCGGMITPPGFMRNYGTDARPVAIPRRRDRPLQRALLATKRHSRVMVSPS